MSLPEPYYAEGGVTIHHGDARKVLHQLPDQFDLIFADPPYNIGVDYGEGKKADELSRSEFFRWSLHWLAWCGEKLTQSGSLWVMTSDDWAGEYVTILRGCGLHLRNWIKWYETFGVNCTRKFNRCSRHILYFVNDPKHFTFNPDAVRRPSDRQIKYNDKRANPKGKILDDVWQVSRVCGTHKERIPDVPTQVPLEIMRRIIGCATSPGDVVLDPFMGSGTTAVAALERHCRCVGIEQNAAYIDVAAKRLEGA